MEQPQKNQYYVVDIEDQNTEGAGVGRIGSFVVFVPGSVAGDKVRIKVVKVTRAIAYGIIDRIERASPHRQTPPCPVAGKCGGCQLLHIDYEKQLDLKRTRVADALRRIGGFSDLSVNACLPCEPRYRYRNKMVFPVGKNPHSKQIACGFYAPRSHRIIPVSDCLIGNEICAPVVDILIQYFERNRLPIYDEATGKGAIRRIFIRNAPQSGEIMVVISAALTDLPDKRWLIDALQQLDPGIVSLILNINTKAGNTVLSPLNKVIWGRDYLTDELLGVTFHISANSFYQVNSKGAEKIYQTALAYAQLTADDVVWDLYCGIGTMTLLAAKRARRAIGIENIPAAVADARENARRNGLANAVFHCADAGGIAAKLVAGGDRADIVLLDPPRKGADDKTLQAILQAAPRRIVYVSCDPATLARDAKALCAAGVYQIRQVQPIDMFAHTTHVETVVLLQRMRAQ